jgi:hypothetical protein
LEDVRLLEEHRQESPQPLLRPRRAAVGEEVVEEEVVEQVPQKAAEEVVAGARARLRLRRGLWRLASRSIIPLTTREPYESSPPRLDRYP